MFSLANIRNFIYFKGVHKNLSNVRISFNLSGESGKPRNIIFDYLLGL